MNKLFVTPIDFSVLLVVDLLCESVRVCVCVAALWTTDELHYRRFLKIPRDPSGLFSKLD